MWSRRSREQPFGSATSGPDFSGEDGKGIAGCSGWVITSHGGGILSKYLLTLYVTGTSTRTGTAIANLQRLCENELKGQYELEIVDVLVDPQRAEDEKILATPTLIKELPLPLRRVIGDLSDKEKVLLGLAVHEQPPSATAPPSV